MEYSTFKIISVVCGVLLIIWYFRGNSYSLDFLKKDLKWFAVIGIVLALAYAGFNYGNRQSAIIKKFQYQNTPYTLRWDYGLACDVLLENDSDGSLGRIHSDYIRPLGELESFDVDEAGNVSVKFGIAEGYDKPTTWNFNINQVSKFE